MYWKSFCNEVFFDNQFGKFVKIQGPDIITEEFFWIYIKHEDYLTFKDSNKFDDVFKEYSDDTKNFLLSGTAPKYICTETNEQKISHKAYVTNASANSVVFYANAYLNNMGLSLSEITKLRVKYKLGNLHRNYFDKNELLESFINQSAFFLNLYKLMNENDRFEHFVFGLDDERFRQVFVRYEKPTDVRTNYNRRIFHDKFECVFMRNHYNEGGKFYENTGVFVEGKIFKENKYYVVEQHFLENLKMRVCRECEKL